MADSLLCFIVACAAFSGAWLLARRRQWSWALCCLMLAGLVFRLFANADQYLHPWDECYHALVAKNLITHPLVPTLVDRPAQDFGPDSWCCTHIWLHKPPLPLWLMAGSMALFGVNEWAVRLPSLLLSLAAILLTYRMGRLLFNAPIGLLAAFLHAVNGKLIELAAGRESSDHVETCHIVMFQAAMWFVLQDWKNPKTRYAVWIGLFAGLAFMSKWTPAFFIPMIWLAGAVWKRRDIGKVMKHATLLGAGALLVALPWLWHIWVAFPVESRALLQFLLRYGSEVVEHFSGPWYFYLDSVRIVFGELVYLPMIGGMLALWKRPRSLPRLALFLWISIPLFLLSAVTTKRETYIMITAPAFFLLIAYWTRWSWLKFSGQWQRFGWALLAALFVLLPLRYGIERSKLFVARERRPEWRTRIGRYSQAIRNDGPIQNAALFLYDHPQEMMFYTGITTYGSLPSDEEMERLKAAGWRVYVGTGSGPERR